MEPCEDGVWPSSVVDPVSCEGVRDVTRVMAGVAATGKVWDRGEGLVPVERCW